MKKKVVALLLAVLLAVMVFNFAFAADGAWGAKSEAPAGAVAPVITSCSWNRNKLSLTWTAVPRNTTYIVMARSNTVRNCAAVRFTTRGLSAYNIPTGSCQDVITILPLQRGSPVTMSRSACSRR